MDAPRCRLLAHDLKLLLLRFALEESFSTYSRGGGRESNIKLMPYIVQMATFLLDNHTQPQRPSYRRTLAEYLSQDAPTRQQGADSVLYMLCLSLFLHSPAEWALHRLLFLRRILYYALLDTSRDRYSLMLHPSPNASPVRPSRSPGSRRSPASALHLDAGPSASDVLLPPSVAHASSSASAEWIAPPAPTAVPSPFDQCKPMLCYFALIDRLQDILKGKRSWQARRMLISY